MGTKKTREAERLLRRRRIRRKITGTPERPRLSVFKSHKNFCIQAIDDTAGATLVAISSQEPEVKKMLSVRANVAAAKMIGNLMAERLKAKGIVAVVFDRGGYRYHGALKAVAEAARESGLKM
ncbi:50S ribosomal protein L18 [candidate division FCPU426 bacterium]|nr:50S ribosomal protein L18 [candidate division FCPU426 bacterium]